MTDRELLELVGIPHGEFYGRIGMRHTRYIPTRKAIQIGEEDGLFDRWANSVAYEFDIGSMRGRRNLIQAAAEIGREK